MRRNCEREAQVRILLAGQKRQAKVSKDGARSFAETCAIILDHEVY